MTRMWCIRVLSEERVRVMISNTNAQRTVVWRWRCRRQRARYVWYGGEMWDLAKTWGTREKKYTCVSCTRANECRDRYVLNNKMLHGIREQNDLWSDGLITAPCALFYSPADLHTYTRCYTMASSAYASQVYFRDGNMTPRAIFVIFDVSILPTKNVVF